ncbi:MAG: hypothetical protein EU533_02010, partial [Promethearchaeota archaeon]
MSESITIESLKGLFREIFIILKQSNPKVKQIWIEPSEVEHFRDLNRYQINEFLEIINSVSIEKGNYTDYIVIDKIKFIVEAIKLLDQDIGQLSMIIDFGGFEELIAEILKLNNYKTLNNFRFSDNSNFKSPNSQKKYEIDIIGIQKKYLLLIDAKQWKKKDCFSAMSKAGNLQVQRAKALKNNIKILTKLLNEFGINQKFEKLILIPFM